MLNLVRVLEEQHVGCVRLASANGAQACGFRDRDAARTLGRWRSRPWRGRQQEDECPAAYLRLGGSAYGLSWRCL